MFKVRPTLSGSSLPVNLLLLVLNFGGLALVVLSALPSFSGMRWIFGGIGGLLVVLSTIGLIVFRGRMLISGILRVLTGSVFIVSGLIKLNDPIGFSYKLAEYFEDGALAYRIKEWFAAPGFSLESLIPYAVGIGVAICILEIVLGVMVIIGGLPKLTAWLLLGLMLFFTFLTWHTANCDPAKRFLDRNTYAINNPAQKRFAELRLEAGKRDKSVKLVSRSGTEIVLDEWKTPQCVTDCGCFGDALKGSVGRSLTPVESFLKDIVLLYFAVWIFAARRITQPNSVRRNWWTVPVSGLLIAALCALFGWYFPLIFGMIAMLLALWFYRSGGMLGNHYGSALSVILLASVFGWYCVRFDTMKDFRPYAVGSNLKLKMTDGIPGVFSTTLVYKNLETGELKKFDSNSSEFLSSKVWERPKVWKFIRNETVAIKEGRRPSIDSLAFNPVIDAGAVTDAEASLPFVKKAMQGKRTTLYTIRYLDGRQEEVEKSDLDYIVNTEFQVVDSSAATKIENAEISARRFILKAPLVILIVSRNPDEITPEHKAALTKLVTEAQKAKAPVLFITSSTGKAISRFRKGQLSNLPAFINDDTELKVVSRSNPTVLILRNGIVRGKYPAASLPTFGWIQKHIIQAKK